MANVSELRHRDDFIEDDFIENLAGLTVLNEELDPKYSESIDSWEELSADFDSLVLEDNGQIEPEAEFLVDFTIPHVGNNWQSRKAELEKLNLVTASHPLALAIGITSSGLVANFFETDRHPHKFWVDAHIHSFPDFARGAIAYFKTQSDPQTKVPAIPESKLIETLSELIQAHSCLVVINCLDSSSQQEFWLDFLTAWQIDLQSDRGLKTEQSSKILITSQASLELSLDIESLKLSESLTIPESADLLVEMGIQGDRQDLENFGQLVNGNILALTLAANLLKAEEQIPQIRYLVRYGNIFDLNFDSGKSPRQITTQNVFDRTFKRLVPKLRHLLAIASIYTQPFNLQTFTEIQSDEIDLGDLQKLENLGLIRGLGRDYFYCEPQIKGLIPLSDFKPYHEQAIKYLWTQTKPYFEWESDRDVGAYLAIFHHCCELGEYYRAFYIIHDDSGQDVDRYLGLQGKHFTRISLFTPLLKAWQEIQSERPELGIVLMGLGDSYSALCNYDRAIASYQEWLQILIKRNDPLERNAKAQCLYKLAHIAFSQSPDRSLRVLPQYQESLEIATRSGDRLLELNNLLGLGNVYSHLKEYTHALEYYERHLHLARETKDIPAQIDCLPKLAFAYKSIEQHDKALELYRLHLSLIPVSGSNQDEVTRANSLENLAHIYQILGEYAEAKVTYQACLDLENDDRNKIQTINCLIGLGTSSDRLGQFKEAITYYQQALGLCQGQVESNYELECLVNLALVHNALGHYKDSVIFYEKALRLSLKDRNCCFQAQALIGLGNVQNSLGKFVKAIQFYEQAWEISKDIPSQQAIALENLGNVYNALGQYPEAMELFKKSLAIAKQVGNLERQAQCLNSLGQVLDRLGYYAQALQFYQEWIDLKKAMGDRTANLGSLIRNRSNVATGLINSSANNTSVANIKYAQAIEFHQQWIEVKRKMGDRAGEANSLGNLGNAYFALGQYPQAIQAYQQCLEMARTIGDRRSEASSLSGLGSAFFILGQYTQAIEFHERSLEISQKIDDLTIQAKTFSNLGKAYYSLGQYTHAAQKYLQCLELIQKIGNRQGEANVLGDLGNAHHALGQYAKAINFYQQWLEIAIEIGDRSQQGNALGGLGNSHNALGQYAKAGELYQQWLEIAQENSDTRSEANALAGLGNAYNALGEYSRAIEFHQRSLKIQKENSDRLTDRATWSNLIDTLETLEQKSLAPNPYASIDVESTNQDESAIHQLLEAGLSLPHNIKQDTKEIRAQNIDSTIGKNQPKIKSKNQLKPQKIQANWLNSAFDWLTGNK
jgi:tetratricopeptide (TPR) repeat protein